jgi:hypothetical protein
MKKDLSIVMREGWIFPEISYTCCLEHTSQGYRNEGVKVKAENEQRPPYASPCTSSMTVTSGGDRKRIGGPHVPEPLLT